MWHEKKVIAWLLRDLTISRVHMQYKRLSPMPWYLPKARSLGIHRIHRPLYGANDRLIVVDTIAELHQSCSAVCRQGENCAGSCLPRTDAYRYRERQETAKYVGYRRDRAEGGFG